MKRIINTILIVVFLSFLTFRTYFFGINTINLSSKIKLEIPKYIFLIKEEKNEITMKTIRSYNNTKKEIDYILENYSIISCNNKKYFYSETQDYTITKYEVKNYIILNSIIINYEIGNYCDKTIE